MPDNNEITLETLNATLQDMFRAVNETRTEVQAVHETIRRTNNRVRQLGEQIDGLNASVTSQKVAIDKDIGAVKGEVAALRGSVESQISGLRGEVDALRTGTDGQFSGLKTQLTQMKSVLDGHTPQFRGVADRLDRIEERLNHHPVPAE